MTFQLLSECSGAEHCKKKLANLQVGNFYRGLFACCSAKMSIISVEVVTVELRMFCSGEDGVTHSYAGWTTSQFHNSWKKEICRT